YLTKPFGTQELLARVRVALRHAVRLPQDRFEHAGVVVDVARRTVTVGGQPVSTTPREYDVLRYFVANRDRVLTHEAILREVWGAESTGEAQYLRNVVLSLRRKLEADPAHPRLIVTEPGIGYRLNAGAS